MAPATQDLDEYYLNSILFGDDNSVDSMLFGDEPEQVDSMLFGDEQAEQIFQDIMDEQNDDHWPRVNLPLVEERIVEEHGIPRRVRVYKPFQRIHSVEREEFKNFLKLIF
jgi:hypothetical protein